jgi:hypothetical protein
MCWKERAEELPEDVLLRPPPNSVTAELKLKRRAKTTKTGDRIIVTSKTIG